MEVRLKTACFVYIGMDFRKEGSAEVLRVEHTPELSFFGH
jgi:hypothetical protein